MYGTHDKGLLGELVYTTHLIKKGFTVLTPVNPNSCYDLVVEQNSKFTRIQIKYCTPKNGILRLELDRPMRKTKNYKERGVDAMGAYDSINEKFYLVPLSEVDTKTEFWLRVDMAKKNPNAKNIHSALKYEI